MQLTRTNKSITMDHADINRMHICQLRERKVSSKKCKGEERMSGKEIFSKIAHFEMKDKVFLPSCWQGFWDETIERWQREGLPGDGHIPEYFDFDRMEHLPIKLSHRVLSIPPFKKTVLREDEVHQVIIDQDGAKKKILKQNRMGSMDQFLEYPVKDKKSWNEYKKRLDPDSPARFPCWWEQEKKRYQKVSYPLGINVGGFFGWIRDWVGLENLSYLIADDPCLIEEMEEHIEYFVLSILKKVLNDIEVDFAHFWEDMAYKTASLPSPSFVKKYMVPHYKRITEFLHSNGVDIITVDSDGNIWELIPIWLDCGINGVLPNEVAAGMDVVKMRKKFGKNLIISGGIDKRILAKSKGEIEAEVKRKVGTLLKDGGYFPGIDHTVPPDVPLENYLYYLRTVRKIGQ